MDTRGLGWIHGADRRGVSLVRGHLGDKPLKLLFDQTARALGTPTTEGVFWCGRCLVAVDGIVFDLPCGKDNEAQYAIPAGGALPQACLVALAECGTLALLGAELDFITVGERPLFERLLPRIGPDTLLLADRGFPSYDLYIDGISEVFALITNLLDPHETPALELARNYSERRHIELLFRLIKVDLRTSGGVLCSRSPQGVRQEIWALPCLYQALRALITRAAVIAGLDTTRISFPPALDTDIPCWIIRHHPSRTIELHSLKRQTA